MTSFAGGTARPVDPQAGLPVSGLVQHLATGGADAWAVHIKGLEMRAAGEDAIVLSVGDPDFDTPARIVDAAVEALRGGDTHYTMAGGVGALCEAIAQVERHRLGRPVSADEVVASVGAQNALYTLFRCLLDPGDEALLLGPPYTMFPGVIAACGATPVVAPLDVSRGCAPDLDAIERAITPRTRALLANFPHNPSGAVASREEWEALVELTAAQGIWLVSDEAYCDLCYDAPFVSPASLPGDTRHVAVVRSLSKSHAMTGWRVGWIVATASLCEHLRDFMNHVTYGAPGFVQRAAVTALSEAHPELDRMRDAYRERRDHLAAALGAVPGLDVLVPPAGIFCMVNVRGTGLDGNGFAEALLAAEMVSVLPGAAFGPEISDFVRISLCEPTERLDEAARRIERFVRGRAASADTAA